MKMFEKVKNTITKYGLLKPDESVVVGLSGGPDSTALALALAEIAPSMGISVILAHYNHGLRGAESDTDEREAGRLASRLGLAFVSGKMDATDIPKGLSPEDFYRRRRYQFFDEVAKSRRAGKIALGHNLQDQAETVLLHLIRGSGLEGLKGILPLRDGKYIRPLLEVSRRQIIAYLKKADIAYRQDGSNESKIYLRNKIRLELLPYLKNEFNPKFDEALAQMAQILRDENNFIGECVNEAFKSTCVKKQNNKIVLNIGYLGTLHPAIRRRMLKKVLEDFNPQKNGVTFLHIDSLAKLLQDSESGKKICLPCGIEARREYENLILERLQKGTGQIEYLYEIAVPGQVYVVQRNLTVRLQLVARDKVDFSNRSKHYIDFDKIRPPLVLRNRRAGDWFQPLGMCGRQKLKSFFINRKITQQKRDEMMLLADRQAVLLIENMHLNDQVKITPETKNILELEII